MANVLAGHRSSAVVAGALLFGAGALVGHVLTQTGPWGRPEISFLTIALVFGARAVYLFRRLFASLDRVIRAWAPADVRAALDQL